jgi:hypothetical protein
MKRAIDTIVHDQADGPVPANTPAPDAAAPAEVPATEPGEPTNPDPAPAGTSTSKRRRSGGEE